MGKRKSGYNADARANKKVVVDNSAVSKIKLDTEALGVNDIEYGGGDDLIVLPSKKRKTTKVNQASERNKRILTKKERRQLQCVVDRKTKKEKRADLLAALSKVQVPESELKFMTSTQDMHHKKSKKSAKSEARAAKIASDEPTTHSVSMIRGANKKANKQQQEEVITDSESSDCEITESEEEPELEEETTQEQEETTQEQEETTQEQEETTQDETTQKTERARAPHRENNPVLRIWV